MPCFGKTYCYISKQSTQSEFLDSFYCGHVTYQIWAWFETFKGNVNWTNTANFDAYWTSGAAQKGGFEISLATDRNRLVVKFLPPSKAISMMASFYYNYTRNESFTFSVSCANQGNYYLNPNRTRNLNIKEITKGILVASVVKWRQHAYLAIEKIPRSHTFTTGLLNKSLKKPGSPLAST